MSTPRLLICRFPGNGTENHKLTTWLMNLSAYLTEMGIEWETLSISDTPVTMSRNQAVQKALEYKFDYILMIDSDMIPDINVGTDPDASRFFSTAWKFMMDRLERERLGEEDTSYRPATIAAPYCGPSPEELVYVFQWAAQDGDGPTPDFALKMIDRRDAAIRQGCQEVAALPTGLILYDARVFKNLPQPWFEYEWGDVAMTIKSTTEDVFQTRNASLLGFPQFVAWDCWAGHAKTRIVGKPRLLTPDIVSGHLRTALLNHPKGAKLRFVAEDSVVLEDNFDNVQAHAVRSHAKEIQS